MHSVNKSSGSPAQDKFLFEGIVVRPLQDNLYFFLSGCLQGKAENIPKDFKLGQDYARYFQKMQDCRFSLEKVLNNPEANAAKKRDAILKCIGFCALACLVAVLASCVLGLVLGAGPLFYSLTAGIGILLGLICCSKISQLESFYKSIDETSLSKNLNNFLQFFKEHPFPKESIERLKVLGNFLKTHSINQNSKMDPSPSEQVENLACDLETIGCRILHSKFIK